MDASNLPKKINICGVPFKIVYKDQFIGEQNYCGFTYGHEKRIEINLSAHYNEESVRTTLLHECIHAILYVTGHSVLLDDNTEESLVVALENALGPIVMQLGVEHYAPKKK